ncbi:MAG: sulfurtransferase TusA family protein [gamma proteobacterium symbiont of Taylorina sp.]|nr:sulfurtransferase TusA family protein [gamma proteobacterium symbiont of Taylorina sp.]
MIQLDARRLLCPLPVIRTQDAIATMVPGETIIVTSTDPGAKADIPAWCRINGHKVIDIKEEDNEIIISIKVAAG